MEPQWTESTKRPTADVRRHAHDLRRSLGACLRVVTRMPRMGDAAVWSAAVPDALFGAAVSAGSPADRQRSGEGQPRRVTAR